MWPRITKGTSCRPGLFWDVEQNSVQNINKIKYRLGKSCISKSISSIFRNWVSLKYLLIPLRYCQNLKFVRSRQDVPFVTCTATYQAEIAMSLIMSIYAAPERLAFAW